MRISSIGKEIAGLVKRANAKLQLLDEIEGDDIMDKIQASKKAEFATFLSHICRLKSVDLYHTIYLAIEVHVPRTNTPCYQRAANSELNGAM